MDSRKLALNSKGKAISCVDESRQKKLILPQTQKSLWKHVTKGWRQGGQPNLIHT